MSMFNACTLCGSPTDSGFYCTNPLCRSAEKKEVHCLHQENAALKARIAELEAERRWIPVTERLPGIEENGVYSKVVLIWCPKHKNCYSSVRTWENLWESFAPCSAIIYEDVTHWMPLPAPPAEGE